MKDDTTKLTDSELFKISLERDKNGCYTKRAIEAQTAIWEAAGRPFKGSKVGTFNNSTFEDDSFGFGENPADMYDDYIDKENDRKHKGL